MVKRITQELYDLACIGRDALASLPPPTCARIELGLTRASFLYAQIEDAATLPIAQEHSTDFWESLTPRRRWQRRSDYFTVPGFCYARLFNNRWMIPAICTLGPYPDVSDVARLSAYFRPNADEFAVWDAGVRRRGSTVCHIKGVSLPRTRLRLSSHPVDKRLHALKGSLAGAAPPNNPDFPALPRIDRRAEPPSSHNARRDLPQVPRFPVPPGVRRSNKSPPPRSAAPRGVGPSNNRGRSAPGRSLPHAPYRVRDPNRQTIRRSPPPDPASIKSATRDPYDDLLESLKSSLKDVPRATATNIWHDFLSWLSSHCKSPTFSRLTSLPVIRSAFKDRLDAALSSLREEEDRALALKKSSDELAKAIQRLSRLEKIKEDLGDRAPDTLEADLELARQAVHNLSATVDSLEDSDTLPPASEADADEVNTAGATAAIPNAPAPLGATDSANPTEETPMPPRVPAPWPEDNYKGFYTRTADAFPAISKKVPLSDLLVVMEAPIDSKLLMPRELELYSTDELTNATAKGVRPWLNRFEDPVEPCKSWSVETFTRIYKKPGLHFLIARVAQRDAQWRDKKLDKLRQLLSARWKATVTFERINPRHDWLLCTIPEPGPDDPAFEIFSTALIRLSSGNASYVVRLLTPISTVRDLDVTIKGSVADPLSVFHTLKKRQLAYEANGTFLGWRVTGVRPSNAVSKYRVTALLEHNAVPWSWTHQWEHPHGSLPVHHNLLDFSPVWTAVKPYACQCCYNSDHFTLECPLVHMRIGGVPIVSPVSLSLMMRKKPAERLVVTDRTFTLPPAPADPVPGNDATSSRTPIPFESPARPLPPDVSSLVETSYKFLTMKFHPSMKDYPGLTVELIRDLCTLHLGDVHMIFSNLQSRGYEIPWHPDTITSEWSLFQSSNAAPGSVARSTISLPSPPRYFKQVQFIKGIISLLPTPSPAPNIPEIVAKCHGDLQSILRHLEIAFKMSVPPYSADSLNDQFSNWLISPDNVHEPMAVDPAPAPPLNPRIAAIVDAINSSPPLAPDPAALPQAPATTTLYSEEITRVSPHALPPRPLAAEQQAPHATPQTHPGMTPPTPLTLPPDTNVHPIPEIWPLPPVPSTRLPRLDPDTPPPAWASSPAPHSLPSLAPPLLELSSQPSLDILLGSIDTPQPPLNRVITSTPVSSHNTGSTATQPLNNPFSDPTVLWRAGIRSPGVTVTAPSLLPPSSPILLPSETQVLDFALSSPTPAATTERSFEIPSPIPWPSSAPTDQHSANVQALCAEYPSIGEELTWRILRRLDGNVVRASAELSTLNDMVRSAEVLQEAFPAAPSDIISSTISSFAGNLSAAFASLSGRFISAWDPELTPARLLASKNVPPAEPLHPEFVASDPSHQAAERDWWRALLTSKRARVSHSDALTHDWFRIIGHSYNSSPLSPRTLDCIRCLGVQMTDPDGYHHALSTLRALPSFNALASHIITNNLGASAMAILPIMLEDGLISPSAAAWLAIAAESYPELSSQIHHLFRVHSSRFRSVWNDRNRFLNNFRDSFTAANVLAPASNDGSIGTAPSDSAAISVTASHSMVLDSVVPHSTKGKGRARSASISSPAPYDINDPNRIIKNPKKPGYYLYRGKNYKGEAAAKGAATRRANRLKDNTTADQTSAAIDSLRSAKQAVADAVAAISAPAIPAVPPKKFVRDSDASTE